MADSDNNISRLVELETLVTHLQRDLESLNSAVIEQQKQLESLGHLVARLDDRLLRLDDDEPRNPAAERPPHY